MSETVENGKASRGKRILFGCLGGCGFVLLVTIGSCVGFMAWLNAPGDVLEPRVLLGADTTGYAEWTLRLEDPGTAEFVEAMLQNMDRLNRRQNSVLPDSLEQILNASQAKSMRKDFDKFFPLVLVWTERPDETPGQDEHLFSFSARGASHQIILVDWFLGLLLGRAQDVTVERHNKEKIYLLNETNGVRPAFFIRRGIVFLATDIASARDTLDRVAVSGTRTAATTELEALFDALPAEHQFRGVVTNENGELLRILDTFELDEAHANHPAWAEVRHATMSAGFAGEGALSGAVELVGPDAAWAETHRAALGAGIQSLFDALFTAAETGLGEIVLERDIIVRGDRVRLEFNADDIFRGVLEKLEVRRSPDDQN